MKVLLREVGTRKYLTRVGGWTNTKEEAYDFSSSADAIDFWSNRKDRVVEIVLSFEDPYYDVTTSLTAPSVTSVTFRRKNKRWVKRGWAERGNGKRGGFMTRDGNGNPTVQMRKRKI